MKRLSVVVSLLLACAAWSQPVALQGKDLVTNGSFERGLAGWEYDGELSDEPGQAHTGGRCVTGEVTEPNQARFLRRSFQLDQTRLYRLSVWVRATNRTKLAIWVRGEGNSRFNIAQDQNIPRQWVLREHTFSVPKTGTWQIEFVAPSSNGAPAGRMWIDDVSLFEVEVPGAADITRDDGYNDFPSLSADATGAVWAAWLSEKDGADRAQLAALDVADESGVRVRRQWTMRLPRAAYVLDPQVVADPAGGAWLLCSAEVNRNWDIYAAHASGSALDKPLRLTSGEAVDRTPVGAVVGGKLWVIWESNERGERGIYAARLDEGRLARAARVSARGFSSYAPAAVVLPGAEIEVAYHSFRDSNYDLYARSFDGRRWSKERRLTTSPRIDRNVSLAATPEGVWMAWEGGVFSRYAAGRLDQKLIEVGRLSSAGVEQPGGMSPSPFGPWCERPTVAVDAQGRVWVAARRSRGQNAGWDVLLHCYSGSRWEPPYQLTVTEGRERPAPMIAQGDALIVALQCDTYPGSYRDVASAADTRSNILLSRLDLLKAPAATPQRLEPAADEKVVFPLAEMRRALGEDAPHRTIEYDGRKLHLYFGNFHEHSSVSVCNRRGDMFMEEDYQHERDLVKLDFASITDHGYNESPYMWRLKAKLCRQQYDPGRLVTFLAEEWTSTFEEYPPDHPYGYYGHRNLILADPYWPEWYNARDRMTPRDLWAHLRAARANFVHIPHQLADTGNVPTDWTQVDPVAQPVAEIFQIRGSYEYDGAPRQAKNTTPPGYFLQDAWAKGVVIGVIASPDHGGGYGKACVYAPELTREALLDAIRARHTYGTTAAKILLDARVNGHLMGEEVPLPQKPSSVRVDVRAIGTAPIERIDVCRSNKFIYTFKPKGADASFIFQDEDPLDGVSYYYVRVIQTKQMLSDQEVNEIAWSSPVWVKVG